MSVSPPDPGRTRRKRLGVLLAIFFAALVPRLFFTFQYERAHPQAELPAIDEASYDGWAREIAGGNWLGDEIFFQEPLYAYALAGVYSLAGPEPVRQRHAARLAQAALGALTAVGVALLALRLFSPAAGVVAGLALAFYRPAIWMGALLLKPGLFLPVLVALLLALLATRGARGRARLARWGLLGLLVGAGALLRGNMLILAPAFVLWPLARALAERRSLRAEWSSAAAVAVGLALALAPVIVRNHVVGGRWVLSTSGAGTNVYGGNNAANPYGLATEFDWVRGVPEHEADDWRHEAERRLGRALEAPEVSSYWLGQTLDSMRSDPGLHASIFWHKLRLSLGRYEVPDNHFIEWDARWVPLLAWPLPGFGVWGTLGLAGLFALLWRARREARLRGAPLEVAALAGLYLATIVLTVISERIRLALVPLLLPFAAEFVVGLRRPREHLGVRLAALTAAALLVFVPVLPQTRSAADFDERDFNLAVAWLDSGEHAEELARLVYDLAARHPSSSRVALLAADLDYRRARELLARPGAGSADAARAGQLMEAAYARLQRVGTQGKPRERFGADLLAGAMLQFLGRWDEAGAHYEAALRFDPQDRDLRRRRAVVLAEGAMVTDDADARNRDLQAALALLQELLEEAPEPELERLADGFRRALE